MTGGRDAIVVFNAGSASLKFALFAAGGGTPEPLARGGADGFDQGPALVIRDAAGVVVERRQWPPGGAPIETLMEAILGWIAARADATLVAAGHRVALGGMEHSAPARVDAALIDRLRSLTPLAPLHMPRNLEPMEILARRHPGLAQVACFDTAFHRTNPRVAQLYAIPRELTDAGVRRYGFHGLSYEFVAQSLRGLAPQAARGRVVAAHLGGGASLCAMVDGRSVASTMGFSALSGVPMATRPGDLDPGVLLWLMTQRGMDVEAVQDLLYSRCGLAGVSGIGGDMRTLLASEDPHAREAIELYAYRIVREVGSLAAAMGGLDALVFTGGVGENAPAIRALVARGAAWLGVALDEAANAKGGPALGAAGARVCAWAIRADEELMVARHTAAALAPEAVR